jgi:hypothetical protein
MTAPYDPSWDTFEKVHVRLVNRRARAVLRDKLFGRCLRPALSPSVEPLRVSMALPLQSLSQGEQP